MSLVEVRINQTKTGQHLSSKFPFPWSKFTLVENKINNQNFLANKKRPAFRPSLVFRQN
jgi:hypothetical protein